MYDVIVIGLGPGGSTAACRLAQMGLKVLGLEKAKMPRSKPCAGCISARIHDIFDEDITALSEKEITRIVINFHGEGDINLRSEEPVAYMVNRATFDHHLMKKAKTAGADVRDSEGVNKIEVMQDGFKVYSGKQHYECRFLIAADGVNGISSRLLGYNRRKDVAWAFESDAKLSPKISDEIEDTARLDLGVIPYGYGWIFPKNDSWSFGVGSGKRLQEHPKKYYQTFLKEQDINDRIILEENKRGYRIPYFNGRKTQLFKDRSLLIGDAAGLVDPFLGEGIYYAIRSGQIAAETIHNAVKSGKHDISSYQKRISEEFYPEFEIAKKLSNLIYHYNRFSFALFKFMPNLGNEYLRVIQGKLTYEKFWSRLKGSAKKGLFQFIRLFKISQKDIETNYDNLAHQYDVLAFIWNYFFAKSAWTNFQELVENLIPKNGKILDAGCGTGETTKALFRLSKPSKVACVDISEGMLNVARKKIINKKAEFKKVDMRKLPFDDNSFDAVVSTWAIETLPDPKTAVNEFLRVIKDDGYVIYTFSSTPTIGIGKIYSFFLEALLGRTLNRHFLSKKEQPFHKCEKSSIFSFGNGIMTVVVLRKCCTVDDVTLPCVS